MFAGRTKTMHSTARGCGSPETRGGSSRPGGGRCRSHWERCGRPWLLDDRSYVTSPLHCLGQYDGNGTSQEGALGSGVLGKRLRGKKDKTGRGVCVFEGNGPRVMTGKGRNFWALLLVQQQHSVLCRMGCPWQRRAQRRPVRCALYYTVRQQQ